MRAFLSTDSVRITVGTVLIGAPYSIKLYHQKMQFSELPTRHTRVSSGFSRSGLSPFMRLPTSRGSLLTYIVAGAGLEPARPQGPEDFLTTLCYHSRISHMLPTLLRFQNVIHLFVVVSTMLEPYRNSCK